jgi:hypothetical protein
MQTLMRCRCLVVRLAEAHAAQKFLFLGGFLAPWSMAGTFGIATDAYEVGDQFLLVLTAPLLEWKTSQVVKAPATSGVATARSSSGVTDAAPANVPKRACISDEK